MLGHLFLSQRFASSHPQAFELLCDLLLLYSTTAARSESALQSLVHLPSDSLRSEMAAFVLDYIFSDAEDTEINGTVNCILQKHFCSLLQMSSSLSFTRLNDGVNVRVFSS